MKPRFQLRASDHLGTSDGKRFFNEKHFAESAPRYDFATRVLSFGQDANWKRALVAGLPDQSKPVCVDVACGTGDITFLLAEKYPDGECIGSDLTQEMIDIATERSTNPAVRFSCGDMQQLPFEDDSVDILTGGYAIRNAPDLRVALAEFRRVVKPGGTVAFLDFSRAEGRFGQTMQSWMLGFWGGIWGLILHGNPEVHGYIAKSLRTFPSPSALEQAFAEAGFEVDRGQTFLGGMMKAYFLKA